MAKRRPKNDRNLRQKSKALALRLTKLRQQRLISQARLSELTGIPRSTLTQLESGSANPSLSTLLDLAAGLEISLEELLTPQRAEILHLEADQIPCELRRNAVDKSGRRHCIKKILPDPLPGMDIEEVSLSPGGLMIGHPHSPGTKEYLLCTKGNVEVTVEDRSRLVKQGDVLAFPGHSKHRYQNTLRSESRFVAFIAYAPGNL